MRSRLAVWLASQAMAMAVKLLYRAEPAVRARRSPSALAATAAAAKRAARSMASCRACLNAGAALISASRRAAWACRADSESSRRMARSTSRATMLLVPSQIEPRWASRTKRGSLHSSM
ncbi:hypothetical protein D3C78_1640350 [compost metagenome]